MTVTRQTTEGKEYFNLYTEPLQDAIDEGWGDYVNGDLVLKCINEILMTEEPPGYVQLVRMSTALMYGFVKFCDGHLWQQARDMTSDIVTAGNLIQADYDLIDGLLPV